MKKTVIVKAERRMVEFEYRVIDKLVSCQKSKRWDKQGGWLPVETYYHGAIAIIDGVEYPSVRRWHTNDGRYSEQFFYNGHFYDSYKKMIERILESADESNS